MHGRMMGVHDEPNQQYNKKVMNVPKTTRSRTKNGEKSISVPSSPIKERGYIINKASPKSTLAWKCSTGAPTLVLSHYVSPGT